jgi:hypothetical protein
VNRFIVKIKLRDFEKQSPGGVSIVFHFEKRRLGRISARTKIIFRNGGALRGRLFIFQLLGRGRRLRRKIAWLDCHFLRLGRGYELRGTPFCRWETPLSKTWRRMDDFMM